VTTDPTTTTLLREAAEAHPLLLHFIANPPTYELTVELPAGCGYYANKDED
jgi:hypothetical protein